MSGVGASEALRLLVLLLAGTLIGRTPAVLSSGLYAIPALVGAALTVAAAVAGWTAS